MAQGTEDVATRFAVTLRELRVVDAAQQALVALLGLVHAGAVPLVERLQPALAVCEPLRRVRVQVDVAEQRALGEGATRLAAAESRRGAD